MRPRREREHAVDPAGDDVRRDDAIQRTGDRLARTAPRPCPELLRRGFPLLEVADHAVAELRLEPRVDALARADRLPHLPDLLRCWLAAAARPHLRALRDARHEPRRDLAVQPELMAP